METDTALVWADGIVVLNAVAHIGVYFPVVVDPADSERYYAVGDAQALDKIVTLKDGILVVDILNRGNNFSYSLEILGFIGKAPA